MPDLTGTPIYDKSLHKPVRSALHLAFIRTLPCSVPDCRRKSEAAHIGPHGTAQKASDTLAAPLCHKHHRIDTQSLHKIGRARFDQLHGIHLLEIARKLSEKPRIRVEQGRYVARIDGEDFVLRPIEDGLKKAVQSAIATCKDARRAAA